MTAANGAWIDRRTDGWATVDAQPNRGPRHLVVFSKWFFSETRTQFSRLLVFSSSVFFFIFFFLRLDDNVSRDEARSSNGQGQWQKKIIDRSQ